MMGLCAWTLILIITGLVVFHAHMVAFLSLPVVVDRVETLTTSPSTAAGAIVPVAVHKVVLLQDSMH